MQACLSVLFFGFKLFFQESQSRVMKRLSSACSAPKRQCQGAPPPPPLPSFFSGSAPGQAYKKALRDIIFM